MLTRADVQRALDGGGGVLRLEPSWVPRTFMIPGRRLKLHPDDLSVSNMLTGTAPQETTP